MSVGFFLVKEAQTLSLFVISNLYESPDRTNLFPYDYWWLCGWKKIITYFSFLLIFFVRRCVLSMHMDFLAGFALNWRISRKELEFDTCVTLCARFTADYRAWIICTNWSFCCPHHRGFKSHLFPNEWLQWTIDTSNDLSMVRLLLKSDLSFHVASMFRVMLRWPGRSICSQWSTDRRIAWLCAKRNDLFRRDSLDSIKNASNFLSRGKSFFCKSPSIPIHGPSISLVMMSDWSILRSWPWEADLWSTLAAYSRPSISRRRQPNQMLAIRAITMTPSLEDQWKTE